MRGDLGEGEELVPWKKGGKNHALESSRTCSETKERRLPMKGSPAKRPPRMQEKKEGGNSGVKKGARQFFSRKKAKIKEKKEALCRRRGSCNIRKKGGGRKKDSTHILQTKERRSIEPGKKKEFRLSNLGGEKKSSPGPKMREKDNRHPLRVEPPWVKGGEKKKKRQPLA